MAINSLDQMINSFSSGKSARYDWNKITATTFVGGRWYDFSALGGLPIANTWPGTALNWVSCSESTGNGTQIFGIPHGGNVSTDIKHLINMSAWSTSTTGVPSTLMLVDMQGYWPGISNNTNAVQTLVGTPTLRYASGAGLRLYAVQTATAGSTAQNIAISYTNQAGTAGRTMPVTVAASASAVVPTVLHSGVAANNYGPFLPLANGDTGIQNVASVTMSAANTGTFALVLARPLATITLSVAGLMTEKDLLNQIPSLPRIVDGACLTWIYGAGAATASASTFAGGNEFIWG